MIMFNQSWRHGFYGKSKNSLDDQNGVKKQHKNGIKILSKIADLQSDCITFAKLSKANMASAIPDKKTKSKNSCVKFEYFGKSINLISMSKEISWTKFGRKVMAERLKFE